MFRGLKYKLGNGKKARFWHEVWLGECLLKIAFPYIFKICNHKTGVYTGDGTGIL
jgi:hypothetical protein